MHRRILALSTLALFACKQDSNIAREKVTETFFQEPPAEVDILWVVDNSQSMVQEQEEVADKFEEFITHLDEVETEVDFHIGILTTDMDSDNPDRGRLLGDPYVLTRDTPDYVEHFQETVQVGIDGSDMERGLEAVFVALTEPMVSDVNEGFLRSDATLLIIFVSDENDCSDRGSLPDGADGESCYTDSDKLVSVRDYVTDYRELKDDGNEVIVSAIVGPEVLEGCEDTVPGTRYLSIAENLGGIQGNICDEDFTEIMGELGLQASGIRTSFELADAAVEDTLQVWVYDTDDYTDEDQIYQDEENGWTYDPETLYLTFHGDAIPDRGYAITVEYEISAAG